MLMDAQTQFDAARAVPASLLAIQDGSARPSFGMPPMAQIETPDGWIEARHLTQGSAVVTLAGEARVRAVELSHLSHERIGTMIRITGGAFGNCATLELLPDQPVALESRLAQRRHGSPWVTMAARSLLALPGVSDRAATSSVALVSLAFDRPEIVFAGGDVPILCPAYADGPSALTATKRCRLAFPMLTDAAAARLLRDRARIIAAAGGCA